MRTDRRLDRQTDDWTDRQTDDWTDIRKTCTLNINVETKNLLRKVKPKLGSTGKILSACTYVSPTQACGWVKVPLAVQDPLRLCPLTVAALV